ncbi:MAG: TraM recognition domain-containing protein [Clostridia bacterium]|nr:TraM recognition domain-containing protein [Clostridia bacterium]
MKIIDNFLKKLGVSRNTFATYVLTLITVYLAVDRIVEFMLMLFTGVSYSYWGPIQYTLALACPILAFLFSGCSEFASTKKKKVTLFNIYIIGLSIIAVSMFTQWLNMSAWLLLVFNPGYVDLVTDFSDLIRPALTSLTLLFPVFMIPKIFDFLYFGVNDSKDMSQSIWDYGGIDLSDKKAGHGPYTCEVFLCQDGETAKMITIPESSRYQSMFVCGASGSGKTSLIYEPLIARDLERKFFFREVSKEMGFTALKTGIATLNGPYNNDYLNANFNLNMLIPSSGNEDVYKAYMKKMILDSSSAITYKNCGITVLSPDREITDHMMDVCKNFGLSYNIIDPSDKDSIGLNPFVYDDTNKIAITISSVLKTMCDISSGDDSENYRESIVMQAIENMSILLKEMYPRMNEGMLPNLNDMLKMFTNFDLVEKMCEILASNEKLKEKYSVQLAYFRKNFYKNGSNRETTETYIDIVISQLDKLLRLPGVKSILCNRHNNIDFDKMLANGEITFVCTRRGDLGASSHKAFGLFFLISMQNAVLRRPGSEKSRVPNFLYIDEFPDFICKATEPIFTMYRKYKVGTTISAQNLEQLDVSSSKGNFKQTILSNCANKIFTGGGSIDELEWWGNEFGQKREWSMQNSIDFDKMKYDSKHGNVEWKFVPFFKPGKLQSLGTKDCAYKIRGENGKPMSGQGKLNFLESKYKEPKKIKTFDFGRYSDGVTTHTEDEDESKTKKKFDIKNLDFIDERNEFNPIQTDTTDSNYLFDNEDAIVVNLKKKKK